MAKKKTLTQKKAQPKDEKNTIALLTDFGLQDHYVAAMKGSILTINPHASIIDISHQVQPHHIGQASYLLWSSYCYFPKGTIFVCVVDPGVGSNRSILAVKTTKYTFLAPDNGLLDFVLNNEKNVEQVEVSDQSAKKFIHSDISSTFHGRDIIAPLAAHLSLDVTLQQIGREIKSKISPSPFVSSRSDLLHSHILHIDQFGNVITNLTAQDFDQISKSVQAISVGRNLVSRWIRFYDEAPENTPSLIVGSNGLVEISIKRGNAAHMLNASLDTPLKVYWR
jgi:S-adenosyl-L-methionine hydrolase (adenosine-forming)